MSNVHKPLLSLLLCLGARTFGLLHQLEEWSLVSFAILDIEDEESIEHVLMFADNAIQYGENLGKFEDHDIIPILSQNQTRRLWTAKKIRT